MKTVCKQVYSHYPDFDLAHKKDFIKATVKSVCITHSYFNENLLSKTSLCYNGNISDFNSMAIFNILIIIIIIFFIPT